MHLVYLDETGYNVWTRRSQGRSRIGHPARREVHTQRGTNVMCTLAISPEIGLLHYRIKQERVTSSTFQEFFEELLRQVHMTWPPDEPVYVIMDNARPHKRVSVPDDFPNVHVKFLPAYSPFLNPTEHAHSAFKAAVKRELHLPETQVELGQRKPDLNLQQSRAEKLLEIGEAAVGQITHQKCFAWFRHAQTYLIKCQRREHIDG